jgi:hypothetical protein
MQHFLSQLDFTHSTEIEDLQELAAGFCFVPDKPRPHLPILLLLDIF